MDSGSDEVPEEADRPDSTELEAEDVLVPLFDAQRRIGEALSETIAAKFQLMVPVIQIPQIQLPGIEIPRISIPVLDMSWLDGWTRQLVDLEAFDEAIRQTLEPLASLSERVAVLYQHQWQDIFRSLADLAESFYPPNLREAFPSSEELEKILVDEGVPLMWVPGPPMVRALLDAPDAPARRRIIGRRWKEAATDCEAVLTDIDHPDLADSRRFALDAVSALRAGHASAAQALAANLLDSVLQKYFSKEVRVELTKNDFKNNGVRFKFDDYKFKAACTFAPVWYAHARYYPHKGDPVPRFFGRHASAHGVSRNQYSRVNAVYAVLLVTSVIKFFDVELAR